jgi:trehalose/maltose hydrolase-like predicted phosphorylase
MSSIAIVAGRREMITLSLLLLLSALPAFSQDSSFVLVADRLKPYTPAYIGNGYFSLASSPHATTPAESYMAWLYDHGEGDIPRNAALPPWNAINYFDGSAWLNDTKLDSSSAIHFHQSLQMYDGLLSTSYTWKDRTRSTLVEVEQFVSRADPNLAAVRCSFTPDFSGTVEVRFPLQAWAEPKRMQLDMVSEIHVNLVDGWPDVWYPGRMVARGSGRSFAAKSIEQWITSESEGRGTMIAESVHVAWSENVHPLSIDTSDAAGAATAGVTFSATSGSTYTFYKFATVSSLRNGAGARLEGARPGPRSDYAQALEAHKSAWHEIWKTDIVIAGDPGLQKLIHSMLFYLLCSIREGTGFSIPPMGLSSCGYYGHIFWDADTWMFPALLAMHPDLARSMVMFRYRTLDAAMANARRNHHRGAMYPWESDETGAETTPKFAYQNALEENHVMGDVALAQWQYFLATADTAWLRQYGYPVIRETAEFWMSRARYDKANDRYNIDSIVSVDEGMIGIRNDTYTNAVAQKNIELAERASRLLGETGDPKWPDVMRKLVIPYDASHEQHPTYEHAPPDALGSVVSLLSYPIELPMSERAKRNNFQNAIRRMKEQGAGVMMTITFAPIVAVELRDSVALDDLVRNAYTPYLRGPFNVLAEAPTNNSTNFLTGAGGYLQQVIYGYTGLRWGENGLMKKWAPLLPSGVTGLTLKNFSVRGKRYDITVGRGTVNFLNR